MKLKIKSYKLFLLIFLVPFTSLGQSIDSNIEQTISLGRKLSQGIWAMWPLGLFSFLSILSNKKFIIIKRKNFKLTRSIFIVLINVSKMVILLRLKFL